MDKTFFTIGAISGFLCVAIGAFGAHILKSKLTPDMLNIFEVGVRFQMYHALALVAVAFAMKYIGTYASAAGWMFTIGSVFFSGSLYALSTSGLTWLGAITPIGGLLFLGGWASLIIGAVRSNW